MNKSINHAQETQLSEDCESIVRAYPQLETALAGSRLLLSGGTGFFGKWILFFLRHLIQNHNTKIKVDLISRNPQAFLNDFPQLHLKEFQYLQADVRTFTFDSGADLAIHAATDASAKLNNENPSEMFDVNIAGTRNFLKNCGIAGIKRILLTSSGAVYGKQSHNLLNQPEDVQAGPDPFHVSSAYAEGKRVSEFLAALHAQQFQNTINIARCYAFLGPFLPIDTHFAAGNFVNDCLNNRPIRIKGDGTTVRSYQHPVDLVGWLISILTRGEGTTFNVGGERSVTIAELAKLTSEIYNSMTGISIAVNIEGRSGGNPIDRYVPSTQKAKSLLNLSDTISLEETIRRTLTWHMAKDKK